MRWLLLLALVLPAPALALGPAVLDSPDLRQLQAGPMVFGGSEGVTCTFAAGQAPRCSDGRPIATARAGTATCLDSTTATANKPCVSFGALESFAAGFGGRTAGDVHTISTTGFPSTTGYLRVSFRPAELLATDTVIFDGRTAGGAGVVIYIAGGTNTIRLLVDGSVLSGPALVADRDYTAEVRRDMSGTAWLLMDGVVVATASAPALKWASASKIGANFSSAQQLNGSISRISWTAR